MVGSPCLRSRSGREVLSVIISSKLGGGREVYALLCAARAVELDEETRHSYYVQYVLNPALAAEQEAFGEYAFGTPDSSDESFVSSDEDTSWRGRECSAVNLRNRSRASFLRWWEYKRQKLRSKTGDPKAEPFTGAGRQVEHADSLKEEGVSAAQASQGSSRQDFTFAPEDAAPPEARQIPSWTVPREKVAFEEPERAERSSSSRPVQGPIPIQVSEGGDPSTPWSLTFAPELIQRLRAEEGGQSTGQQSRG